MAENHRAVIEELKEASPDIDGVSLDIPESLELTIVAQHRWQLRNTAVQVRLHQRLARKRQAHKEAETLGKQLDQHVRDIAEIDRLYPKAKAKMVEIDLRTRPQEETAGVGAAES